MKPFNSLITYILKGFGYTDISDFSTSVFKIAFIDNGKITLLLLMIIGTIRTFIKDALGLDMIVFLAFVVLIIAEFQTGLKASMSKKGERFQSRKFGRMILKIGTYILIIWVLYSFSSKLFVPDFLGFEVNPFKWLYYMVFLMIVFQLFISWMENLAVLGYSEAKGILGIALRKFNKWFEFDGTKDNGNN